MNAIFITKVTKSDCNLFQKGPNTIAMMITKGTKYDCNNYNRSPYMIAISIPDCDEDFWTNLVKAKELQSYIVRSTIEIAIIFGSHCDHHSSHI